jgi:hypothetical protein
MKSKLIVTTLTALLFAGAITIAQSPIEKGLNAITKSAIKGQLDFLASDWTEGRETTTKGEFMAGDYIASIFQIYGVLPSGDMEGGGYRFDPSGNKPVQIPPTRSYFQKINFNQTLAQEATMEIITREGLVENRVILSQGKDFVSYESIGNIDVTSPVIFIGYGYKNDEIGYDDFKDMDLKGKIVLRLSGYPGSKDTLSEAFKKMKIKDPASYEFYQALRKVKEDLINKSGAAAVISIGGYFSQGQPTNYPFRINTKTFEGDKKDYEKSRNSLNISLPANPDVVTVPSINLESKIFNDLVQGSGINIGEFEKTAASKLKSGSREIKGKMIHLKNTSTTQTLLGRNVLARIEGENPNEVIVVGAHYDHIGISGGYIYNGADDNASGTVGVMTLAKAFIATGVKPKKTIIFAAWTGEEKGLLGSYYFVQKYPKVEEFVLNLNFDMISRRPEKDTSGFKAGMDYTEGYPILKDLVEKANTDYGLGLEVAFRPAKQPMGGTDFTPFSEKKVPIYSFDAAFTSDYHGPMDHSDKANLDLMEKIIKAGFVSLYQMATSDFKPEAK